MKLLLLSDIPPCSDLTGGLVLAQQCRFVEQGKLANFCVLNPCLDPELFPDLGWIPTKTVPKPNETGVRDYRGVRLGGAAAYAIETRKRLWLVPKLVQQAVAFGREQGVDALWVMLQGQTMARMALPVARALGVPLYTQVWDPISWWLQVHDVDHINRRIAQRDFNDAIRNSEACATASWAMAEHYEKTYGTRSLPVIAGLDAKLAREPATALRNDHELVLGLAGQFYAGDAWHHLIEALNSVGWRGGGRQVRIVTMGHYAPTGNFPENKVDHRGWVEQKDAIRILADDCDILYCPYPFAEDMRETATYSFPSKLVTYFAAGRPVLFHGPETSSPSRYLCENDAGLCVSRCDNTAIMDALSNLTYNGCLYMSLPVCGNSLFQEYFTLEAMKHAFEVFLYGSNS